MSCIMRHWLRSIAGLVIFSVLLCACDTDKKAGSSSLSVFAGSVVQLALPEIAQLYEKRTGTKVDLFYGSSGSILSQIQLGTPCDVYIPGSEDFMIKAQRAGLVDNETTSPLVYLLPAICVKPENPKNIHSLADLARPGIRVGIARPEQVCVGLYAVELLEANGLLKSVLPNIVVTTDSCANTAAAIALSDLDAVIGWRDFQNWNPERIQSVFIGNGERAPRVCPVSAAVVRSSKNRQKAFEFMKFLCGPQARDILRRHGYITENDEILKLAPGARSGGEYHLPADFKI